MAAMAAMATRPPRKAAAAAARARARAPTSGGLDDDLDSYFAQKKDASAAE